MELVKAITLTPPWGTLIAIGAKRIETRSWPTSYRGPIAIHQAKGLNGLREPGEQWMPKWALDERLVQVCESEPFATVLRPHLSGYTPEDRAADLPRGTIVAVARLVDCLPTQDVKFEWDALSLGGQQVLERQERAFGNFAPGRFAWLFERVLNLYDGIPCSGGRGLWDVPEDVVDQLVAFDDFDEE